jgi:hypothetical protein
MEIAGFESSAKRRGQGDMLQNVYSAGTTEDRLPACSVLCRFPAKVPSSAACLSGTANLTLNQQADGDNRKMAAYGRGSL